MPSLGGWETLVLFGVFLALLVASIVSITRQRTVSGAPKLVWVLVCLALPLVGPVLWFAFGRKKPVSTSPEA